MIEKEEGIWGWRGKIWGGKWGWLILKIAFPLRAGSSFSRNKGFQVGFGSKQPLDGIFLPFGEPFWQHFCTVGHPWGILGASLGVYTNSIFGVFFCSGARASPRVSQTLQNGVQGCPKASKMAPKGAQSSPQGPQKNPKRCPKLSQVTTRVFPYGLL